VRDSIGRDAIRDRGTTRPAQHAAVRVPARAPSHRRDVTGAARAGNLAHPVEDHEPVTPPAGTLVECGVSVSV